jgi:hypothetical protein
MTLPSRSVATEIAVLLVFVVLYPSALLGGPQPTDQSVVGFNVLSSSSGTLFDDFTITMLDSECSETQFRGGLLGSWSVSKAYLRAQHARYLLFAHVGFDTVAVRVDDALLSQRYRRLVSLAPHAVE